MERLQKLLAQAGYGSRRQCEKFIEAGQVTVNGKVAQLGMKADPSIDKIEIRGQRLTIEPPVYIMLNKPVGVISSLEDELGEGRTTVRDLINLPGHLYPVGRLDKQSEGLILMTNDGDMAHKLTHPRYEHPKVYRVKIEGPLNHETINQWRQGVWLEGQKTAPADIVITHQHPDYTWLTITMYEGRKRQIRRVAAQLEYNVRKLIREQLGPLTLSGVKPGEWRHLTKPEIGLLREATQSRKRAVQRKRGTKDTRKKLKKRTYQQNKNKDSRSSNKDSRSSNKDSRNSNKNSRNNNKRSSNRS
ncbi:MAG TPA: pseudouridine synthase [Anaerolineae bacterium]|nr:pseudouridine synthase [Anaerolineae bacterium]